MPFLILFAKDKFGLTFELIGNFLLFRTIGMLFASLGFYKTAHKIDYKILFKFSLIVGTLLPVTALFLSNNQFFYQLLFILSGIFVAIYRISYNGVLLEISTNENRALYTGIVGAGSVVPVIFPLIGSWVINYFGFSTFFILFMLIISFSLYFIFKLDCQA